MSSYGRRFKPIPGKFSSAEWRAGNAARVAGAARSQAIQTRRLGATMAKPYVSRRFARVVRDRLGENKYFDTTVACLVGSDMIASAAVQDLCIVPQGTTVNTRIGKKLRVLHIQMKGQFYCDPVVGTTSSNATLCRMSLVWDREPDKAALVPTTTDIYKTNDPNSNTNRDNAPRFKILREYVYNMQPPVLVGGVQTGPNPPGAQVDVFDYIRLDKKDLEIIWTSADTTGATANKVKGNLLVVFTADQTKANGGVKAWYNFRVDFEDEASKQSKR